MYKRQIVRCAEDGEKITTLDGQERELQNDMLVIADKEGPVAVAGVMGGECSGIMDDTTTIVFESAMFNGFSVRSTAKRLGMRTEASSRYEKELNPESCLTCLNRALELVQLLDAGDVVNGVVDCFPKSKELVTLPFDWQWVNNFIGIDVSADEQKKILENIGFTVENGTITAPWFRNDIEHMADISEEIARFYGYGNIPNRALSGEANGKLTPVQQLQRLVNETMLALGVTEIATFSFVSPKVYDKICLPADSALRKCVVISNPLGEDTSVMRTTAVPSILDVLARNYKNRNPEAWVFEPATIYIPQGEDKLPVEAQRITVGLYGADADFFTLKGITEELLRKCGVKGYDVAAVKDDPTFHPGRTAEFTVNGERIAILGEIHPQVAENYGIGAKAYVAAVSYTHLTLPTIA